MKHIIIIIFFFVFSLKVNASECFEIKKENIGYFEVGESLDFDPNDHIYEYGEWSENTPTRLSFEKRDVYYYREMKGIKYIHLFNFLGEDFIDINEIVIKNNGVVIPYTIMCDGCNDAFNDYIQNGNYLQENSYISIDGYLRLELNDYYQLDNLTFEMYLTDFSNKEKRYELNTTREEKNELVYTNLLERLFFTHRTHNEVLKREWRLGSILFKEPEFDDYKLSFTEIKPTKFRDVLIKNQYRDIIIKFQHFKYLKNSLECINNVLEKEVSIKDERTNLISTYSLPKSKSVKPQSKLTSDSKIKEVININEANQKEIPKINCETNYLDNVKIKSNINLIIVLVFLIIIRGIIDVRNKLLRK